MWMIPALNPSWTGRGSANAQSACPLDRSVRPISRGPLVILEALFHRLFLPLSKIELVSDSQEWSQVICLHFSALLFSTRLATPSAISFKNFTCSWVQHCARTQGRPRRRERSRFHNRASINALARNQPFVFHSTVVDLAHEYMEFDLEITKQARWDEQEDTKGILYIALS